MANKKGTILIQEPLAVATMDDRQGEFSGGHILVGDGEIRSLGPEPSPVQADEVIDASGMVVLPGFINTHHHLYQSLTRNIPRMQDARLFGWLSHHYELWRELTGEAVYISALTGLLELMKSGTTTSSDHLYLFPKGAGGELIDAEIKAARELGIRFQPARGSMSLGRAKGGLPPDDLVQTEDEIHRDIERLLARYHDTSPGAMVRIALAPCSPFSVTTELMKATAEFAKDNHLRIHTHLAETMDEERFCLETFGQRPAAYMDSLGWLTENSWFAHAIHLNDEEIRRMGAMGAGVSHCPSSNMRLGSGIARIKEILAAGVGVGLGVDGAASNDSGNMLMEIRNAMMLSRLREPSAWLSARESLWLATRGGAQVLGRDDIGQLAVGKRADIVLFSMEGIEYAGSLSDPLAALVFAVRISPVDYVIIDGVVQIREGASDHDESRLLQEHNRISHDMLVRAGDRSGIDFCARS